MRKSSVGLVIGVIVAALILAGILLAPTIRAKLDREALQEVAAAVPTAGATGADRFRSTATMRRPRPKKCLQAEAIDLGGGDEMGVMRVGNGLSPQQINESFQPYHSYLASCQPVDGEDHSGSVTFELHVGCDGIVHGVEVTDDSLYEPEMIECLEDRLTYVEFPAHDMEDGMYFEYPLIFHKPTI